VVVLSCGGSVTVRMVDGWSIGPPVGVLVSSDERCDMAGVAKKAFQKAYPGERGSSMEQYAEGRYVASSGRLVSLPHGRRLVAVFTLGIGRRVALGLYCELGPALVSSSPPDQPLIDQWADTPLAEGI
jgi:hypothetical protein